MLYQGKHRADDHVQPGVDVSQEPVRRHWLLRWPTFGGLAVALVFWWFSLRPSMLPAPGSPRAR
jgi:uncharacterized membrane protein